MATLSQYFNSIKVQLKHPTIKGNLSSSKFQFHKGTIKTIAANQPLQPVPYFNSIKVQLKPSSTNVSTN